MTVHADDFFSIGENTFEKATRELLGRNPRVSWWDTKNGRVQAGFGRAGCASKASSVFNISATAEVSELSKYLHMYGN